MGAFAQSLPEPTGRLASLWNFLKHELAPYRGRTAVVARIVTASTLVMIVCMTCRIPSGAIAAIFTFLISRETLQRTARSAATLIAAAALGGAYVVLTAMLFEGSPLLRLLWAIGTFFLVFYVLSAVRNYNVVVVFGVLCAITIPVWGRRIPAELKVEQTLWAVGVMALGSAATIVTEVAFAAFRDTDEVTGALARRLSVLEEMLTCYARGDEVPDAVRSEFTRLASVGTSGVRRMVHRLPHDALDKQRLSAVVALVGRLVDLGADFALPGGYAGPDGRSRIREDAQQIAGIRAALVGGTSPRTAPLPRETEGASGPPILVEIEKTTFLIRDILAGDPSMTAYLPPDTAAPVAWLAPGPLSDPKHLKFALRGCLAAGLCYIAYNALFWPGLSFSVVTCVLTALTTIGASRQKQFLRFAGALIGGVVLGMGVQIFVLPDLDSIAAFALLFACVTGIAAWFATSSTRLSFLGVQIAVGFDLVHLQEFRFQISLVAARDIAVGILLGLTMMWLAYELLWTEPAAVEMKKAFASAIRMLAQLAREPLSEDRRAAVARALDLREAIGLKFNEVRSLADGVLFEFGPSRRQDLAWRERIRRWQPQLWTLFLWRFASFRYRIQLPGFELPESIRLWHREYDNRAAALLDAVADRIDRGAPAVEPVRDESLGVLPPETPDSFATLLRGIDRLTVSVAAEIVRDSQE